jgi:hypothetical protein
MLGKTSADQASLGGSAWRRNVPCRTLKQPIPSCALIISYVVFIANIDWLQSVLKESLESRNFGFAIERRDFAESLRACFLGSHEIWPA